MSRPESEERDEFLLSALDLVPPRRLVRDGCFRALGFVDHPGEAMLVALYQGRYIDPLVRSPNISCVITLERFADQIPSSLGLIVDPDPKNALYDIHEYLLNRTGFYGPSVPTVIHETATAHPHAYVAPTDVRIGAETLIEANATIRERTRAGQRVVVHSGSVIGAEGFGARRVGGNQVNVPHTGGVYLADEVHVLSNCTIVRATFSGNTIIGEQTWINAQSYVAHNVRIGKRCRIGAGAVIAGSAHIGDDVWVGPNAIISNSIRVGDGASVSLGAVVIRDVNPGERVSGHYAISHRKFLAFLARLDHDAGS